MQELVHRFLGHGLSRRGLMKKLTGLGLGLAVVKEFVSMLGGTVTAHSDGPGKGAAFTVRLPWVP
jgi:signal transduction histidine kinase